MDILEAGADHRCRELIKAVRFAAQNKVLQKKVYLDEATGLPNKNKCERDPQRSKSDYAMENRVAMCVFDMNNLRTINNTHLVMIREASISVHLRYSSERQLADEFLQRRDGGDEFIAVLKGLDHAGVRECLKKIREQSAEYSDSIRRCQSAMRRDTRFPVILREARCVSCSDLPTKICTSTRTVPR
ncbi:MAG: hypothetical protein ACLTTJ_14190 [Blautia sp.]